MAASLYATIRNSLCRNHVTTAILGRSSERILAAAGCQVIQVRHKKGQKRFKIAGSNLSERKSTWKPKVRVGPKVPDKEDDPELMARVPEDDVWIREYYPDPRLKFLESVHQLRQFASPEMADNMAGVVTLHLTMDMSTKKKTKFLGNFSNTIVLPHKFGKEVENRVVAFCKTPEDIAKAREAGAVYVGGLDLISTIEKGELHHEDYDIVISTLDMVQEIGPMKKIFKDLFPHQKKGTLGLDIEEMVSRFVLGKTYESTKDSDNVGHLTVEVGELRMTDDQLMENFKAYLEAIWSHRATSTNFIKKAYVTCPPSKDRVILDLSEVRPVLKPEDKESKRSKKSQIAAEEEVEENQESEL